MTEMPKPISIDRDTVVSSRRDWEALVEAIEDSEDRAALLASRAGPAPDDLLPVEAYRRIRAGESPLRVWRTFRGLTLAALSEAASVSRSYLSEIENGRKPGSAAALARLAPVLRVDMEDLVARRTK